MKTSDEIFLLLKALSRQEKSYFKKFATAFADEDRSNYIKLFDKIAAQALICEDYDEEKIKKGSYSGKFLKNLSFHKNYLYNMILSAMVQYQKENKGIIAIRNLISQAEFLFDKSLYSQSLKVLLRAKKLALDTDKHSYLNEILNHERILYRYTLNSYELKIKSKQCFKEQYEVLEILKNNIDYYQLNDSFGFFAGRQGTGLTRTENETAELDAFFENPLLKDINNAKTFFNKTVFNTLNMQHTSIKNDYEKGYYYLKANEKLWEANLHKLSGKLDNYIFAIYNLMLSQGRTKRFDEFIVSYQKMKGLEKRFSNQLTEVNRIFIFYSLSIHGITQCLDMLDEKGLDDMDSEVEEGIKKYESKMQMFQKIILYYFQGTSNFVRHNFEKSLYWMSKIINLEKTDLSQDYQCYSRIVYLISYYELGYLDSMEYALKSAYHFLSKRERIYKYEDIILQYLRRSFRLKSKEELYPMLIDMKKDLEKLKKDPLELNAFDAFNILIWIESKLNKKRMMKVMSEMA